MTFSSVSNAVAWITRPSTSQVSCVTAVSSPVRLARHIHASPVSSWPPRVASVSSHRRHASAAQRLPQPRSRLRTSLLEAHICRDHSFSTCNLMSHERRRCLQAHWKKTKPTPRRHFFSTRVLLQSVWHSQNTSNCWPLHRSQILRCAR